jgi:hypothetical protein
MDIVTIKVSELKEIIETEIKRVIETISEEKKIKDLDLFNKIKSKWNDNLFSEYSDTIKEKKIRPINPNNFCMARKPNLKRCTRIKKINCDYCASHQFNILHGRIDEEPKKEDIEKNKLKKEKYEKKQKKNNTIKLKPIIICDKEYYIDNNNHLYITEKDDIQIKYRHIGDWNESNKTINLKENVKQIIKEN